MSHELRTPLNAIIGYCEMLQEEAQDLAQDAFVPDLRKINSAGKHLLELINAVLDLSKIEAGQAWTSTSSPSTWPTLVTRHRGGRRSRWRSRIGNRLDVRCDSGAGEHARDLTKVRQALFNLLSNACKFTERGTVTLSASAPGRRRRRSADLRGDGHRDRHDARSRSARLFQEFTQADARASPALRRHGTRPGALPAALPAHGRRRHGGERGRTGQHLHACDLPAEVVANRRGTASPVPSSRRGARQRVAGARSW